MKRMIVLLLLILALATVAFADQIYGTIRIKDAPVRETEIVITFGNIKYKGATDKDGTYRIYVRDKGKGVFSLKYRGKEIPFTIFSYDDPIRYDFELVENGGEYSLIRR